jgi:hypothetical protein
MPPVQPLPPRGRRRPRWLLPAVLSAAGVGLTVLAAVWLFSRPSGKPLPEPSSQPAEVVYIGAEVPSPAPPATVPAGTPGSGADDATAAMSPPAGTQAVLPAPLVAPTPPAPPVPVPVPSPPVPSPPAQVQRTEGWLCEYYDGLTTESRETLRQAPCFAGVPSQTSWVTRLDLPRNRGDHYAARVCGYVVPAVSGAYRFCLSADDRAELWLSRDELPRNVECVARVVASVKLNAWQTYTGQVSELRSLAAGSRYYAEALLFEREKSDHLQVAWQAGETGAVTVLGGRLLRPWIEDEATVRREQTAAEAEADGIVRRFVEGFRFADAAQALADEAPRWRTGAARETFAAAGKRCLLLADLFAFVQTELRRGPLRGGWITPRGNLDVTGADAQGVTVAPGRIFAWAEVPPDQMLVFVNALVPKAAGDPAARGRLMLAAAVFCRDIAGGAEQAARYREKALAESPAVAETADRLVGDPTSLRLRSARDDLSRTAKPMAAVPAWAEARLAELDAGVGNGLLCECWTNSPGGSVDDGRRQGLPAKPSHVRFRIASFDLPRDRGDRFLVRVRGDLVPAESGLFTFYVSCDERGELWLCQEGTGTNLTRIVRVGNPRGFQRWDESGEQKSRPVRLEKGRRYRIEALQKEDRGTDHFSVAWTGPGIEKPKVIPAECLSCVGETRLPAAAEEKRHRTIEDLFQALSLARQYEEACAMAEARLNAGDARDGADEIQRLAGQATAAAREADAIVKRTTAALPVLRSAMRGAPGAGGR